MTHEELRQKAIAAYNAGIMNKPIVINADDADFTPHGKRKAMIVKVSGRGRYATGKGVSVIRWYVAGRIFRQLELTAENAKLSTEWMGA